MKSEIGGDFWISPTASYEDIGIGSPEQFHCKGNDYVWLSSGRSAIKYVLKTIEERHPNIKKKAVLPSFTCQTVIQPFLELGYEADYYPVDKNLRVSSAAILQKVAEDEATVVLFHRYFGYDTIDTQIDSLCDELRKLGKYTIEDCTQSLYSDIPRADVDFFVGSLRKWMGMPDGGFAVCRNGIFENKPHISDELLEKSKLEAFHTKYSYLFENKGNKDEMLAMYRKAEGILDLQDEIFAISPISTKIQANINKSYLIRKRIENYNILRENFKNCIHLLFSSIPQREVPLYFPIFVDKRPQLQKYLIENAIYAPIVWPKSGLQSIICDGAENAYNHLLCIPIDQRYDTDDMYRIVEVINKFYDV